MGARASHQWVGAVVCADQLPPRVLEAGRVFCWAELEPGRLSSEQPQCSTLCVILRPVSLNTSVALCSLSSAGSLWCGGRFPKCTLCGLLGPHPSQGLGMLLRSHGCPPPFLRGEAIDRRWLTFSVRQLSGRGLRNRKETRPVAHLPSVSDRVRCHQGLPLGFLAVSV